MSTETKYQVMGELLGLPSADIETAERQADRIIQIVHGGWTQEEIDRASLRGIRTDELIASQKRISQRKPAGKLPPDANDIIASMKAQGMTHKQIAEKLGVTESASKKRFAEWKRQQADQPPLKSLLNKIIPELYEPGAVEAAAEAKAAEATIRKYRTVEDLVKSMDKPGNFDDEILIMVNKRFPGNGLTVDDIACMRWQA